MMETALFCNRKYKGCLGIVNYSIEQVLNYTYTTALIKGFLQIQSEFLDAGPFLSFHSVYGLEEQLKQLKVRRGAFNIKSVNCARLSSVSTSGCSSPQSSLISSPFRITAFSFWVLMVYISFSMTSEHQSVLKMKVFKNHFVAIKTTCLTEITAILR